MKASFFSILLPTKNRSEIVGDAVRSALNQTFGDFELVVSDNDDSDTATREAIAKFSDPRIRYFRTSGKLPMHENWENAFNLAAGEYVLVLEDKQRLVRNALEVLHYFIERHGPMPISYDIKFARGSSIPDPERIPSVRRWRSVDAIELFCRFEQKFFNLLPKGLDSCAPRKLLREVKEKSPTGMLFSYISPDYASGFMLLSAVAEFLHTGEPLVYIPNNWMWQGKYSNGQASYRKTDSYRKFLQSLPVTREDILKNVPVKSEFLWINSVLYDFFTFYKRLEHHPRIHWPAYYGFCIYLILIGRKLGAGLGEEFREVRRAIMKESLRLKAAVLWDVFRRGVILSGTTVRHGLLRR
ncbi:MAG: glycosyltransferase [Verrucomicrobiales bacterium]|nr:glycosyltransferase [Verrucomicrobiales bacterium]